MHNGEEPQNSNEPNLDGSSPMSAKEVARRNYRTNPNMYYYRLNEPGEAKINGQWSEVCEVIKVMKK